MNEVFKGAQWRRWDLHIHAPGTKLSDAYGKSEDVWNKYIDFLESSPVEAFGITDYFSADSYFELKERYRKRHHSSNKVLFLNIELRLSEAISKSNSNPNLHIIFDNNEEFCSKLKIEKFLSSLKTLKEDLDGVKLSCADLSTKADFESASVSKENVVSALNDTFGDSKPYLIAFPAKNDGVRSTDHTSPRKNSITESIDKFSDLFFGDLSNKDYFLSDDRYIEGVSSPKPVVSGSDAHSLDELIRLEGNAPHFPATWIKCDLNFQGLRQICYEPDSRIYIGYEPSVETRKKSQSTKFIEKLNVSSLDSYDGYNGLWFDKVCIPFNPELTVIIGNKGSCKSAVADMIGLLGESRQDEHFSFLTDKGVNKKFKRKGYAENFLASLTWCSGFETQKKLSDDVDLSKPEAVRYLPQNYFEKLTNEIEIEDFRREIEEVVFSHVEESERLGLSSFKDLESFKTEQFKRETEHHKARLKELNASIYELEEVADPLNIRKVEGELEAKIKEREALIKAKPKEIAKPDQMSPDQKRISQKIDGLADKQAQITALGKEKTECLSIKKNHLQKLKHIKEGINNAERDFDEQVNALRKDCVEVGLNINELLSIDVELNPVEHAISQASSEIFTLEKNNEMILSDDFEVRSLYSIPDLRNGYAFCSEKINELKGNLGAPERKYQFYLEELEQWKQRFADIDGDEVNPKSGTIKDLNNKLSYIKISANEELEGKLNERREVVRKIFDSKKNILSFYSSLKESVEGELQKVRTNSFSVDIESSLVLNRSFQDEFLTLIRKNKRGLFHGSNNPDKILNELVSEVDWNDFEDVMCFLDDIVAKLKSYDGKPLLVKDQVVNALDFYNFLFSLDYLKVKYELKLGGKNLNELSPGEKGLLLLVFYLQLDKHNVPLVIDQPEDNLDNESVFAVLSNCIREAKKNRQVILVTHNPNLAVGADAEQVLYVNLDKHLNYKFSYESGSIENPAINKRIVDILEGTHPAFVKRRLKYQIKKR